MNKELVLITPDVIEECLCEALDVYEKKTSSQNTRKTSKWPLQ
ncbi:MAG: hypothetical protein AB9844_09100 [Clostridiaceae bacterium]